MELEARAKINLSLDVTGKRSDGYHEVRMIMQTIELHDTVCLEIIDSGIEISCDSRWVPSNNDNIAYKAAKLLIEKYDIKSGIKIDIRKRIPVAAGLAGGSTDAAAVMKGMNRLFSLGISQTELMALGKQIGADVPYCIKGGTMLAEGLGEILTELNPLQCLHIVLIKPKIGVSTAWVYKNLNLDIITDRPDTEMLIKAVQDNKISVLAENMKNVLETVTLTKYAVIKEIKDRLVEHGAVGSMMSGSGPSVFGIFKDKQSAEHAYKMLVDDRWDCFLTQTVNSID
ncbi:MAG: 4-(cytidine 5'-diphospho)-2-C-methyl-D-erythritol kinase [Clostridia bacterium]|nr:4-(cytidine 5'-diphospho)-2-C-methyl-D-erythritol kinase [Clostridia bacterium]